MRLGQVVMAEPVDLDRAPFAPLEREIVVVAVVLGDEARKHWCRVIPPSGRTSEGGQRFVALRVRRRGRAGVRGTLRSRRLPVPEPGARRFCAES